MSRLHHRNFMLQKYSEKLNEGMVRCTSLASIDLSNGELETIEFQVLRVGEFYDPRYGVFQVTEERLQSLKRNFDEKILGIDVALDVNHDAEGGAYAWVSSLAVREGGLWATFKDFTPEGKRFFVDKIYKYFSVEFAPFDKAENGKKVTVKDVLRGIALTNRPVIKGMQPTFLSEEVNRNSISQRSMKNAVQMLAEDLLSRSKISKDDVRAIKTMTASLSEEEKTAVAADVTKVEEKATADAAADATAAQAATDAAAAAAAAATAGKGGEAVAAAELSEKLVRQEKEISDLKAAEKERVTKDRVAGLTLSESNKTGFSAEHGEKLSEFITTLSEEQFAAFSELIPSVTAVTPQMLSEAGSGRKVENHSEAAKLSEVTKVADEMMKSNPALKKHEAVAAAQKQVLNKS